MITETKCSTHPDAPHGFDRNGSHMAGHYVCECYGWTPPASIQEELRSVPERSRTTLEAADRIDALEAEIESLQLRNQELAVDAARFAAISGLPWVRDLASVADQRIRELEPKLYINKLEWS